MPRRKYAAGNAFIGVSLTILRVFLATLPKIIYNEEKLKKEQAEAFPFEGCGSYRT